MPPCQTKRISERMREVVAGLVEQAVAQPSADDHAHHAEEQHVFDVLAAPGARPGHRAERLVAQPQRGRGRRTGRRRPGRSGHTSGWRSGPSCRATGSIWGYISMRAIVPQAIVRRPRPQRCDAPASSPAPPRKFDEALQRRVRGSAATPGWFRMPARPAPSRPATCAVDHAGAPELAHALGHPGHAQAGRHQVDDGLHLDRFLRHPRRAARRVVEAEDRVVQRRHDAAREDHQRLGQHASPAAAASRAPADAARAAPAPAARARPRRCCSPGGAKPGECSIKPASMSPRASASSCTSPVASISSSCHLRMHGAEGPHPGGSCSKPMVETKASRTRPALAARGRARLRRQRLRPGQQFAHLAAAAPRRPAVSCTLRWCGRTAARPAVSPAARWPASPAAASCAGARRRGRNAAPRRRP